MVGHHLGQLFLRVGLAATFLTMGLSKVMREVPYQGEAAAILANMGVIKQQSSPTPAPGGEGATAPTAFFQPEEPEAQPEQPTEPPAAPPEEPEVRSLTPRAAEEGPAQSAAPAAHSCR